MTLKPQTRRASRHDSTGYRTPPKGEPTKALDFPLYADGVAWWMGVSREELARRAAALTKEQAWGPAGKQQNFGGGVIA